uniref:Phosphatidylinositol glycan anchor biosynthesis, class T n=1 Tax=Eptatretus burgeri TaxID=7764 RepID=A0A8C4R5M9_EPTBU
MVKSSLVLVLSLLLTPFPDVTCRNTDEVFQEQLLLKPLPSGDLVASFRFDIEWHGQTFEQRTETDESYLRYASLPREIVCTENLTPWKKLLPCDSKAGLATLLAGGKLFNSMYYSLGLHFRPVPMRPDDAGWSWQLTQTLTVVFDGFVRSKLTGTNGWTLSSLFGRPLDGPCPIASRSRLYVDITDIEQAPGFSLNPAGTTVTEASGMDRKYSYVLYNLLQPSTFAQVKRLNPSVNWDADWDMQSQRPWLHVERFLTGVGLHHGGISSLLHNRHPNRSLTVHHQDTLPWFLRVYSHTLTVTTAGKANPPSYVGYRPARDRERPHQLELLLTLPPATITRVDIQFERALLTWTEYPPDANHGVHICAAVVTAVLPDSDPCTGLCSENSPVSFYRPLVRDTGHLSRLYTQTLLVSLPTPDFSMPYNVVCLTCTVVAIGFGSFHNILTRSFRTRDPAQASGIVRHLANLIRRWRGVPLL